MARLIVKSPYIKCGTGQSAGGYLKYIATRERVEIIPDDRPPTRKQEQLITKLTKDFPDVKELLEYEDYTAIQSAINTAQTWRDGGDVLEIVRLHTWIWPRESLESAARQVHVSTSTAKRMYSRFVYEAARAMGYRKS